MCKVINVASQKGGVTKTTTVLNLATALGLMGKKVLVVDLDPQGSLSGGAVTLPDTPPPAQNYRYTDGDELYPTGAKAKYQNNIAAIRMLKRLEAEKRPATSDEQRTLAGYA